MKKYKSKLKELNICIRLGFFLAVRQIKRSSKATTGLIVFVMVLTFLNLVVVRGILVGLIQGSTDVYVKNYSGDIILSNLPKKNYIENSPSIISIIKGLPWTGVYSARYIESGTVEANYKTRINFKEDPNSAGGQIVGIDPTAEDRTTNLSSKIIEGSYLTPDDTEAVLLGANLLKKYLPIDAPGISLLENVKVGDRVRISVGSGSKTVSLNGKTSNSLDSDISTKEFIVKGILKSKSDIDQRIFMLDKSLRPLIGRGDFNVDEIAIVLKPGSDSMLTKNALLSAGAGKTARVQTWEESLPKFLKDIQNTFGILGNLMGSISLVVASITIFIVIFINAITRKKFIGILKGIGIHPLAIEVSYIFQSIFYAFFGILFGMALIYGVMVPYIDSHPINFPFSDGILVAEVGATTLRAFFLMMATLIAGFIPARIVVKRNTLDSILGR